MKRLVFVCLFLFITGCSAKEAPPSSTPSVPPSPVAVGMFVTEILDTDENRVKNLTLCASVLDGVTVDSGAEFSFNNTIGKRTEEKGYKEAKILVDGHRDYGVGGGICQISSTLYNAALDAGMEILERHTHSNEVHYVELGRDAAVSFGTLDFRFKNTLDTPVRISVAVENTAVKVVIYKIVI